MRLAGLIPSAFRLLAIRIISIFLSLDMQAILASGYFDFISINQGPWNAVKTTTSIIPASSAILQDLKTAFASLMWMFTSHLPFTFSSTSFNVGICSWFFSLKALISFKLKSEVLPEPLLMFAMFSSCITTISPPSVVRTSSSIMSAPSAMAFSNELIEFSVS
jgi:hypothetical protein